MDANEVARKAAEHKAAALHHLGSEEGAGATIWARAVKDNLAAHEEARRQIPTPRVPPADPLETWERLNSTALILVVAMDQILAFADRVLDLTDDRELRQERELFHGAADTAEIRDVVAHLDAYAVGEGWRQTGKRLPPIVETYVSRLMWWANDGGTMFRLGQESVDLRYTALQAVELAKIVERVRVKHLELAGEEANAAFRRQYPFEE